MKPNPLKISPTLSSTPYFDFETRAVAAFASEIDSRKLPSREKTSQVIDYYYAVRDMIRYNPYSFSEGARSLKASFCLEKSEGYCLPKAVLLGALARRIGVPARLGLSDVRNHLASPRLLEWLGTDIFSMHGYIDLFLDGVWVKATPAFNKELCSHFGVKPLEFDGKSDSLFHEFGTQGEKYMEYLKDHGTFDEVPVDFIFENLRKHYPNLF